MGPLALSALLHLLLLFLPDDRDQPERSRPLEWELVYLEPTVASDHPPPEPAASVRPLDGDPPLPRGSSADGDPGIEMGRTDEKASARRRGAAERAAVEVAEPGRDAPGMAVEVAEREGDAPGVIVEVPEPGRDAPGIAADVAEPGSPDIVADAAEPGSPGLAAAPSETAPLPVAPERPESAGEGGRLGQNRSV